jgi:hypothetical protein
MRINIMIDGELMTDVLKLPDQIKTRSCRTGASNPAGIKTTEKKHKKAHFVERRSGADEK